MRANCRFTVVLCTLLFVAFCACHAYAQERNYVRSAIMTYPLKEVSGTEFDLARVTVTYYDGLGRPIQQVRQAAGGNAFDIHTVTEYDSYGRPYRTWLPVESNGTSGAYSDPSTLKTLAQSFYGDTRPYTETEYARIPEICEEVIHNPGAAWHAAGVSAYRYKGFNLYGNSDYGCARFDVSSDGSLILNDEYDSGRLRYEDSIDEDNCSITRFFDRENRMVLERRCSDGGNLDTYYVHNIMGQLSYVIPPKAASVLLDADDGPCDTAVVRKLCSHYGYDSYGRMIESRRPGAEPEYLVYDALDNVVMRQDGNLRKENKWRVTKLDHRYRKAVEGIATLPGETRATLQERWKKDLAIESVQPSYSGMDGLFYSDTCGIDNFKPDVAYFYDNYDVWNGVAGESLPTDSDYPSGMPNGMGLLTGKAVWEEGYAVVSAYTYDDRRRLILDCEYNFDGIYRIHTFHKYNFAGDLIGKKTVYTNNDLWLTYQSEYTYDRDYWGNLLTVYHRMNDEQERILYTYGYDEVARQSEKRIYPRNAESFYLSTYDYNIRSQLTELSSPMFSQWLHYQDSIPGSTPRRGGSPSAMEFTSVSESGSLDTCTVRYGYDDFDRLVSVNAPFNSIGEFNENFNYDENGNPLSITRGGSDINSVQCIELEYDGNQISALNESKLADGLFPDIPAVTKGDYETGWTYDANGNRTSDPSKGITSITYNHLNQPLKFTFEDGSYIEHRYRSDGTLYGRTEREKIITTTVNGGATDSWRWQSVSITKAGDFTLVS
ncbi:MAG: hypothetical protein IJ328_05065, partial [Muribaculaceae bacterium]|nr:hypothetical protein [Muribaculaceae bacterium]